MRKSFRYFKKCWNTCSLFLLSLSSGPKAKAQKRSLFSSQPGIQKTHSPALLEAAACSLRTRQLRTRGANHGLPCPVKSSLPPLLPACVRALYSALLSNKLPCNCKLWFLWGFMIKFRWSGAWGIVSSFYKFYYWNRGQHRISYGISPMQATETTLPPDALIKVPELAPPGSAQILLPRQESKLS